MASRRPAEALRDLVASYDGYHLDGLPPGSHKGLPSRHLTFIVALGPSLDLTGPGRSFDAMVGGLHSVAETVVHQGEQHGVQLRVTPAGARALFGMPAGPLARETLHLSDVVGGAAASELVERMRDASRWRDRFAVLDEVLGRLASKRPSARPAPDLDWAWRRLLAAGGQIGVRELAAELGWSRRHFSERFRTEFGLSPKTAARVVRFERARELFEAQGGRGLALVAAEAGYADQAHLTREWRDIAGCTPTEWAAAELPFVQDVGVDAQAS